MSAVNVRSDEPDYETWFEAKLDAKLARMLSRISLAYEHRGKAAGAAFLERLEATIPSPQDPGEVP